MVIFLVCLLLGVTGQRYEIKTEKQTNKRKTKEKKNPKPFRCLQVFFLSVCTFAFYLTLNTYG